MARGFQNALGLTLIVALGWSATASCMDGAQASAAQMACCLQGQHDCERAAQAMACCKTPTSRPADQQSTAPKLTRSPLIPVLDLVRLADRVPLTFRSAERRLGRLDHAAARPPDTPTYLLDSVFLL